jgi:hypothetical protein
MGGRRQEEVNVPFGTDHELVKLLPAFLAKVLVWAGFLLHDADAATVLPDLADIALDEQTAYIVTLSVRACQGSSTWQASVRRRARILEVATDAASDLVFLGHVVVELIVEFRRLGLVVVLLACPASCQRWLDLRPARWLLWLFRGERVRGRRLLRRRLLVNGSRYSVGAG